MNELRVIPCPRCRRETPWAGNPFRPFCSERCKLLDLGAWAGEEYRVPGEAAAPGEPEEPDKEP